MQALVESSVAEKSCNLLLGCGTSHPMHYNHQWLVMHVSLWCLVNV